MQHIIDQLKKTLPPVFLGSASDELTGGAVHWRRSRISGAAERSPRIASYDQGQKTSWSCATSSSTGG
jgi:hypothetical protein